MLYPLTRNKAWVLGFFASDGTMYIQPQRGNRKERGCVEFSSNDEDVIEKIKVELNAKPKVFKIRRSYRISLRSGEIFEDVKKIGFRENKSLTLQWPDSLPKSLERDFIRGFFDGDGCIGRYVNNWGSSMAIALFASASREFLERIAFILTRDAKMKDNPLIRREEGSRCYKLRYSTPDVLKLHSYLYTGGLCMDRKREKFENIVREFEHVKFINGRKYYERQDKVVQ